MNKKLLMAATALITVVIACKKETVTETVTVTNTVTVRDTVTPSSITKVIGATHDATIKADMGPGTLDSNYASGIGEILGVGVSGDNDEKFRTLVQFDLSTIPSGATITDVKLNFSINRAGNSISPIYVHKLTEAWEKGTVNDDGSVGSVNGHSDICEEITTAGTAAVTWKFSNYSTLKKWGTPGGSMNMVASDSGSSKYSTNLSFHSQGLVNDVKEWLSNPSDNFGWILRFKDTDEADNSTGRFMRYISSEGGAGNGKRPKLVVTYTMP